MSAIRHDAWTEAELQVLYDRVNDTPWFSDAFELLPDRTEQAIRKRMFDLRGEASIIPRRQVAASRSPALAYDAKIAAASRRLLVAIRAMLVAEAERAAGIAIAAMPERYPER